MLKGEQMQTMAGINRGRRALTFNVNQLMLNLYSMHIMESIVFSFGL